MRFLHGETRGDGVGILITRLVILYSNWSSGFRDSTVVTPLVELSGDRPLKAVDLSFQSGDPGDLPSSPQSVFQAYFILNTSRDPRGWVTTWTKLGCGSRQGIEDDVGEVPNTCVDIHAIEQFRVDRNFGFQVVLEVGRVSTPEVRSVRWVMKG